MAKECGSVTADFDTPLWYALQTKPRHEKNVTALLQGKGYELLLPLYQSWHRSAGRMRSATLPLFPGYAFCRFAVHRRLPVLMTPGVFSIVSRGHLPEPIAEDQIAMVQAACGAGLPVAPWPYLEWGDRVRVEVGPLQGVEGIFITEKSTSRIVISVDLLKRSLAVEVDRDWVWPLSLRKGPASAYASHSISQEKGSCGNPRAAAGPSA